MQVTNWIRSLTSNLTKGNTVSENYKTQTAMLPGTRNIEVLMKQKEVTVGDGLRIQSWFVQEDGVAPYVVQVIGNDADLVQGGAFTVVMRERKQTRLSDGQVFTELQIAAAQAG
jgi:hypothetical protein